MKEPSINSQLVAFVIAFAACTIGSALQFTSHHMGLAVLFTALALIQLRLIHLNRREAKKRAQSSPASDPQ